MYFVYAENLSVKNTWLMVIMIIVTVIVMMKTMGKITIGQILLEKCNYSMANGRASFKGQ